MNTGNYIVRANAKSAGCLVSFGSIKMKREVKEYDTVNCEKVLQGIGKIKTDPITLGVAYDPADILGQKELDTSFCDGVPISFSIELDDSQGTNGTTFTWDDVYVGEYEIMPEEDGLVISNFSINVADKPTVTPSA